MFSLHVNVASSNKSTCCVVNYPILLESEHKKDKLDNKDKILIDKNALSTKTIAFY